jgi:hypothetical protein
MDALPLQPEQLARLQELTREYARLTRRGAGLGKVLGGGFLLLLAGIEIFGHGARPSFWVVLAPLPLGPVLATAALPFLWLGAREALGRWWERRFGAVEAAAEPPGPRDRLRRVAGGVLFPVLMLLGLVPLLARPSPQGWLRAALVLALALALAAIWGRLRGMGRVERMTCILLFFGPSLLLSGLRMPAGDTLLAFPLVGLAAIVSGLREHAAFLRLGRELGSGL